MQEALKNVSNYKVHPFDTSIFYILNDLTLGIQQECRIQL